MGNIRKAGNQWRWTQRHSCGHQTSQAVFGGKRPAEVQRRLATKVCPRCNLVDLLQENYGERAAEDIRAIEGGRDDG